MKDEIQAGLRNAVERGSSLDTAVASFINAGYNPVEVKEAATLISSGASSIINPKNLPQASSKPDFVVGPSQPSSSNTISTPLYNATPSLNQNSGQGAISNPPSNIYSGTSSQSSLQSDQYKMQTPKTAIEISQGKPSTKKRTLLITILILIILIVLGALIYFSKPLLNLLG